ncbi:uncharacterized protein LOC116163925 [Photinus pyralis]|nr:uncharacterized protein LOC116163925 [Photinus pyralis]
MVKLDTLRQQRNTLHAQIKRLQLYFNDAIKINISSEVVSELQLRLGKCEPLWDTFNELQTAIETACYNDPEQIEGELEERTQFESNYYSIISKVKNAIANHYSNQNGNLSHVGNSSNTNFENPRSVKLPTIKLPTFKGNYDNWLEFHDAFKSIIHESTEISDIQKFLYLKSSLEGEASRLIESIEVCASNYNVAWNGIFDIPKMTKESHSELRLLFDTITKNLRTMKVLGRPSESWDDIIIFLITSKLDRITLRDWESLKYANEFPTMQEMNTFLSDKCKLLEKINLNKENHEQKVNRDVNSKFSNFYKGKNVSNVYVSNNAKQLECFYCSGDHAIYKCSEFLNLSSRARIASSKKKGLCLNCLVPYHTVKDCKLSCCKKCHGKHNTLLHLDNNSNLPEASTSSNNEDVTIAMHSFQNRSKSFVLLSTALVLITDSQGRLHKCRALLDNGSQSNFITDNLCNKLKLIKENVRFAISGVGHSIIPLSDQVNITIKSTCTNYSNEIKCLVIKQITERIPSCSFDKADLNLPDSIKLADDKFNESNTIDILLGASVFWDILINKQITLGGGRPVLQDTKFGWIVGGNMQFKYDKVNVNSSPMSITCTSIENKLDDMLINFWRIEDVTSNNNSMSIAEKYCEDHFLETYKRDVSGKFVVSIPFTENLHLLGDSKQIALNRFLSLEKKLRYQPQLKTEYVKFMQDYINLGHMSESDSNTISNTPEYYLPHHAVIKNTSITTKVRVVFDASQKTSSGYSLNDVQYPGPNLQNDLTSILIRFRQYQFVLAADISKMYRNILINTDQRRFQKIWWRSNPDEPLRCYNLNTVTYGTSSAPFLAMRSLQQIAIDKKDNYPTISNIIRHDFYMDDLLTGADNLNDLIQIQNDIFTITSEYGFELRQWLSNNQDNYQQFKVNDKLEANILQLGEGESSKTLGMLWNAHSDSIQFSITEHFNERITKRAILSITCQIFDPMGLLGPVIIINKIILQKLWTLKLGWDEEVPSSIAAKWIKLKYQFPILNTLNIPRLVIAPNSISIELHGFADASEQAYGACIYVRSLQEGDIYHCNILCGKSRVAPIKQISLPRLELCAAVLLTKLMIKVRTSLRITISKIFYYTDSSIVLGWLNGSPSRWKTFVGNRVSEIQNNSNAGDWYHVRSADNPADLLSRGIFPNNLMNASIWWHGPAFLISSQNIQDTRSNNLEISLPEQRHVSCVTLVEDEFDIFSKYSVLIKLQRVIAYCYRFWHNSQYVSNKTLGPLTVRDLELALLKLTVLCQKQSFKEDYISLSQNKPLSRKSSLLSLNPFLDSEGLIRVGGRLQNSQLDTNQKHPIVLPKAHKLTRLIMEKEHKQLLHCGAQQLLFAVRQNYWPISGRNLAKKVSRECVICFKHNPKPCQTIMGNLPDTRVRQFAPFYNTGVDYAGPFQMKDKKTRGCKIVKCYICIFVCLCTKAIHLDVVSDLSSETFLNCLKRFISRRGKPLNMFSDNGTNFVGANKILKEFLQSISTSIINTMANESINWHFIPPRSPHFGGLWEAGVKSMKYHLRRILGETLLIHEQFYTVLTKIEAILNSRPLGPLSSDPNDPTPLTPSHFLIGRTMTAVPEPSLDGIAINRLNQYQFLQSLTQHFWQRWHKEYLNQLQTRKKWKTKNEEVKIGDLVIVRGENSYSFQWPLARVVDLHKGSDGVVRVVSVKLHNNVVKRAITKISVLPL